MTAISRLATVFALFVAFTLSACGEPADFTEFADSKATWQALQVEQGGSYAYRLDISSWTGWGIQTWLVVEDGQVVRRELRMLEPGEDGAIIVSEVVVEEGEALGNHQGGMPVMTLDAVYDACRNDILSRDARRYDTGFTTREDGVIESCYAVPHGCLDDCGDGYNVGALIFPAANGQIVLPSVD